MSVTSTGAERLENSKRRDLLVTMNQRDDLGDQTPGDVLAVVQVGQAWGFPDCYGECFDGVITI